MRSKEEEREVNKGREVEEEVEAEEEVGIKGGKFLLVRALDLKMA